MSWAEPLIELLAGDEAAPIIRLNRPNGVNGVAPPVPSSTGKGPFAEHPIWHSKVWKAIFGAPAPLHTPDTWSQAQVNQQVAESLVQLAVIFATTTDSMENALHGVGQDLATASDNAYNDLIRAESNLQDQIVNLRASAGAATQAAIDQVLAKAQAYADHDTSLEEKARVAAQGSLQRNINTQVGNETEARIAADKAVAGGAAANLRIEAKARAAADHDLQLNINAEVGNEARARVAGDNRLEGELANGVHAAEAFAVGLVGGLGVPKLAANVDGLAGQVTQLATEVDQCLTPLCDTVTPNASQLGKLGKLLSGFEGAAIPLLLAGLVAEAIADPTAAAGQVLDAASWIPDTAVELVDVVLG